MKRVVILVGITGMLISIAACTAERIPGSGAASSADPSPNSTPSPSSTGTFLPYNDPCTLLSSSDLQELGSSTPPSRDDLVSSHGCSFDTTNASIDVGVRINAGLAAFQANGGKITTMTVGDHQAKEVLDRTDSCVIALGVTNTSRVDVTVTADKETEACPIAQQVAHLIEPKLPAAR